MPCRRASSRPCRHFGAEVSFRESQPSETVTPASQDSLSGASNCFVPSRCVPPHAIAEVRVLRRAPARPPAPGEDGADGVDVISATRLSRAARPTNAASSAPAAESAAIDVSLDIPKGRDYSDNLRKVTLYSNLNKDVIILIYCARRKCNEPLLSHRHHITGGAIMRNIIAALSVSCFIPAAALAQAGEGTVTGRVYDHAGQQVGQLHAGDRDQRQQCGGEYRPVQRGAGR